MTIIKHIFYAALLIFFAAACIREKNDPDATDERIVIPETENTSPVLESDGGSVTISFIANSTWVAQASNTRASDWLSVSPSRGQAGPVTMTLTAKANESYDERNGTITISSGTENKYIILTQKQKDAILLSSDKIEVISLGGTIGLEARANVDFSVKTDVSWISPIETRGLQASNLSYEVAENVSKDRREGHIVFSSGTLTETVNVFQAGSVPTILLTENEFYIGADGGDITVELRSNVDVEVIVPEGGWIKENPERSNSTHTYVFTVERSEDYDSRTAQILFVNNENNLSESVTVFQTQRDALIIGSDEFVITNKQDYFTLRVQTNAEVTASADVDWIEFQYSVVTRSLNVTLARFRIHPNEQGTDRSGNITVTAGEAEQTIRLIQRNNDKELAREREVLIELYNATGGPNWKDNRNWCTDAPIDQWEGVLKYDDGTVQFLILDHNNLVGSIPESIGELKNLKGLYLNNNLLSGTIPESIGDLGKLQNLLLSNNALTGSIPESVVNISVLEALKLEFNQLSGSIPENIGKLSKLTRLNLNDNKLSGIIPASISKLENLEILALYDNKQLGGSLPEDIGNLTKLRYLGFYECNNISGPIPESVGKLKSLESFQGSFCNLSGELPKNLGEMENLLDIRLCGNKFTGTLPESIGELKKVKVFMIRGAELTGELPASMGYMTSVEGIYLSGNKLTGGIPDSFMNLSNLKELVISGNCMDGIVSEELYKSEWWRNVTIDLSQSYGHGLKIMGVYNSSDFSADGNVKVLQRHSKGKGIKLVITGEAFSDRMIADGSYDSYANQAMEHYFGIEPYTTFRDYFDVYSISAVSTNEILGLQTAFNINGGEDRYVWGYGGVLDYINKVDELKNDLDSVCALVMLQGAGGLRVNCILSDGGFAAGLCSLTGSMKYEINHELGGHGFGKLADEYWSDDHTGQPFSDHEWLHKYQTSYGWYLNVDYVNDPAAVLWKDFISNPDYDVENIGIYEGGFGYYANGIYRPTDNSIMRNDSQGMFNAPSRWAIYQRIMRLAGESCSFEDFLEYDKKNLAAIAARSSSKNYVERIPAARLGAPPVIVKGPLSSNP